MIKPSLRCCLFLAFASALCAQNAPTLTIPAPSPASVVKQKVGATDIEIAYSRPGMKGRKIFGGLEPFGEVWRVGANSATKITFSTPVKFGGKDVPAGSYGLFAQLGKDEWTVILSNVSKTWGAYSYDQKDDIARFSAKVTPLAEPVETLLIDLNDIRDGSASLTIAWERTRVSVPIIVDLSGVVAQIEALMASDAPKKPYVDAAMFYLDNHLDLKKAVTWMDAAIAAQPSAYYIVYRKAKILAALGDKAAAKAAAEKSIEMAKADKDGAVKDEYIRLNEAVLAGLK